MNVYVALLRGVNVGGRSKVDMQELRRQFERLGCSDVRTYINSGNVIFRDRRRSSTLTRVLEEALRRRVAVRSLAEVQKLCSRIPAGWTNDKVQKTDVAFLLDGPGEELWNVLRKDLPPRYSHDWGGEATVRNVNTVRKLRELMEELSR